MRRFPQRKKLTRAPRTRHARAHASGTPLAAVSFWRAVLSTRRGNIRGSPDRLQKRGVTPRAGATFGGAASFDCWSASKRRRQHGAEARTRDAADEPAQIKPDAAARPTSERDSGIHRSASPAVRRSCAVSETSAQLTRTHLPSWRCRNCFGAPQAKATRSLSHESSAHEVETVGRNDARTPRHFSDSS